MKISAYRQKKQMYFVTFLISLLFQSLLLTGQQKLFYSDNDFRTPHDLLRSSSIDGEDIDTLCQNEGSPFEIEFNESNDKIYWASSFEGKNNSIKCANPDGTGVITLISNLYSITDISIDSINSKIYWSHRSSKIIMRANLDGSNIETFLTNLFTVSWIEVVPGQNKVYWLQNQTGEFWRANLDGSEKENLFTIARANCMMSIHIDVNNNKIYWLNICDKKIQKADYDGSNMTDVTSVFSYYTYEVINFRLDNINDKIYWAEDQKICSCNLDGTGYKNLLSTESGNYSMAISIGNNGVFWSNSSDDVINRSNLNGSSFQKILNNNIYRDGYGLGIDYTNNHIYWAGQGGVFGKCNFDGSENTQIINGDYYPQGDIAIDNMAGKIYWANVQQSIIQRANLDGSNVENLINTSALGIDLDLNKGKMYWTESETDGKIKRANLNGSNIEEVISAGVTYPKSLKLDLQNKKIYWTADSSSIQRANLDGSNIENLVSSGLDYPRALALDIAGGKMIWSETGTYSDPVGIIRKANLDGSQMETVHESGIIRCLGLTVLAIPTITQLISPTDGISVYPTNISFTWEVCNNVETYHLQVSPFSDFSEFTIEQTNLSENNHVEDNIIEGKYYWRVATENIVGKTDWSVTDSFNVITPPPAANFSADHTSGNKPLTVSFNDNSTGNISTWSWDFGDENTSIEQNPNHEYSMAGVYTVALTVTGDGGSDTETKTNYISVYIPVESEFTCDKTSGIDPLVVNFTDNSTGDISRWAWDFGDGNSSTVQNPSYIYSTAGTFTVSLSVSGDGGTDTETKTDYITVNPNSLRPNEVANILKIYPNPANTSCQIDLTLEKSIEVKIFVYNSQGQIVRSIHHGKLLADNHKLEMDVSNLADGLYYIYLTTDAFITIQKLVISR